VSLVKKPLQELFYFRNSLTLSRGIHLEPTKTQWQHLRFVSVLLLLVTVTSVGVLAAYAWQPVDIPVEVKEPIEILDYPSALSLFPGETAEFNITVQNLASVTYFVEFDFHLNDTNYQANYVTFSNQNYTIVPGKQNLVATMTILPNAPPASLLLTINRKEDTESSPEPAPTSQLQPSLELIAGAAKWAAPEGRTALYVNWKDNWDLHHLTDGANWDWFPESSMENWRSSITNALELSGFKVTLAGEIPNNLNDYDLAVIFAYYAVEPRHEPFIRQYIFNGGSVILLAATQCYLTTFSKSLSVPTDFASIQEWLGARTYVNAGTIAKTIANNPFGTSISTNTTLFTGVPSHAGVINLDSGSQTIALWNSGAVFSFTHEYGKGRVYYQAIVEFV